MKALINVSYKYLKVFLALKVRKIGSSIIPIFGIYVQFLDLLFFDFLNLDKFLDILLALPPTLTILLLLALNAFKAKFDDAVVLNSKIIGVAILLKP